MIQWYDDCPSDPIAAFIYFETVFRWQYLTDHPQLKPKHAYMLRLLIAKRELNLSILPEWEFREGYSIDDAMFSRFQGDVRSILPTLHELCRGEALYDPHTTYGWYQHASQALMEATPKL